MIEIKNNDITMTRGDTLVMKLNLKYSDGEPYEPNEGDQIRFAMKEHYTDQECIIKKDIPTDSLVLRLESDETKKLKYWQTYVYDIQLTKYDGTVDTFIAKGQLKVAEEVD